jgi:hypothetical protein
MASIFLNTEFTEAMQCQICLMHGMCKLGIMPANISPDLQQWHADMYKKLWPVMGPITKKTAKRVLSKLINWNDSGYLDTYKKTLEDLQLI